MGLEMAEWVVSSQTGMEITATRTEVRGGTWQGKWSQRRPAEGSDKFTKKGSGQETWENMEIYFSAGRVRVDRYLFTFVLNEVK